jgi:predicted RNA-binding Zn ribbon-like protein
MALPVWVPEAETKPAPMPLLVLQSFVNTWEADTGTDVLGDPVAARLWLGEAGLLDSPGLGEVDLVEARQVRESIRALLVHNGGGEAPDPTALAALRVLAAKGTVRPLVRAGGIIELGLEQDGGGSAGLAGLLLIMRDAQHDGSWHRLKACRNPDCRWAYYDRSHAGRGAWCDMAVCGNRIKNRNLRSRRASPARDEGATVLETR